jgi:hypothetical protein
VAAPVVPAAGAVVGAVAAREALAERAEAEAVAVEEVFSLLFPNRVHKAAWAASAAPEAMGAMALLVKAPAVVVRGRGPSRLSPKGGSTSPEA